MKKFLVLFLVIMLAVSFTACDTTNKDNGKLKIVTTVFPFYDFAKNVAGDKAEVVLLLPTGAEAHSYEPTMQDVIKIKDCDLFIHLGMNADPWTNNIVNANDFEVKNALAAMEYVELEKEHHNHNGYEYDQHIWTSLRNSQAIVRAISHKLEEKDSENADYYLANAENYCNKLDELDKKFTEITQKAENPIAFADGFPFKYFVKDYSLQYMSVFPGCSGESEPSVESITEFVKNINEKNIKVIFYTETSNGQLPDTICDETGAEKMLFHSCHTVTKKQLNSGITYLELMENNYSALMNALK